METVVWDGAQSSETAIHGIVQVITVSCFCDICTLKVVSFSEIIQHVCHSFHAESGILLSWF